ncbi:MAG: response regulator transcription factor [Clostridia bacterium]|nr:response regulator transcription factor [Clostridia bacterium]
MTKLIYIAEDDANIRELEKAFLEKSGFEVQTFENGDLLYKKFTENPADLVILDIMMPGTDGLSLCAKLREESSVPIIIVSAKGSDIERVAGITIGCDDYLAKPFSPIELVARVQAIFRRIEMMQPKKETADLLSCGDLQIDKARRTVIKNGAQVELTANEFNLLTYLAENKDRAVSRDELLRELWNFNYNEVDTRATDDAMKRLRKKLADCNSTVKIETVRGFGFRIG